MAKARKAGTVKRAGVDPDVATLLEKIILGKQKLSFDKGEKIFSQGDRADSIYFIQTGRIKITVVSAAGKEAVLAMLGPHDFLGEGALVNQSLRICRRSAILTPLNCPGILSPSRNEGDNHVEPGRAEALVRREPSHGRQVDCEKSGGVVEPQCAASPALDSGMPAARSCRGGAWESWTASGKPNSPKNGESDREISLRNVLGIQSTTLQRDADGA